MLTGWPPQKSGGQSAGTKIRLEQQCRRSRRHKMMFLSVDRNNQTVTEFSTSAISVSATGQGSYWWKESTEIVRLIRGTGLGCRNHVAYKGIIDLAQAQTRNVQKWCRFAYSTGSQRISWSPPGWSCHDDRYNGWSKSIHGNETWIMQQYNGEWASIEWWNMSGSSNTHRPVDNS